MTFKSEVLPQRPASWGIGGGLQLRPHMRSAHNVHTWHGSVSLLLQQSSPPPSTPVCIWFWQAAESLPTWISHLQTPENPFHFHLTRMRNSWEVVKTGTEKKVPYCVVVKVTYSSPQLCFSELICSEACVGRRGRDRLKAHATAPETFCKTAVWRQRTGNLGGLVIMNSLGSRTEEELGEKVVVIIIHALKHRAAEKSILSPCFLYFFIFRLSLTECSMDIAASYKVV